MNEIEREKLIIDIKVARWYAGCCEGAEKAAVQERLIELLFHLVAELSD